MTDLVPDKPCEERARAQLRRHVEEFYVVGLEYARMKTMGVVLVDGVVHRVSPDEREGHTKVLLDKLAALAVSNLALMSAYPGEVAAMTPSERAQRRDARQQSGQQGE